MVLPEDRIHQKGEGKKKTIGNVLSVYKSRKGEGEKEREGLVMRCRRGKGGKERGQSLETEKEVTLFLGKKK